MEWIFQTQGERNNSKRLAQNKTDTAMKMLHNIAEYNNQHWVDDGEEEENIRTSIFLMGSLLCGVRMTEMTAQPEFSSIRASGILFQFSCYFFPFFILLENICRRCRLPTHDPLHSGKKNCLPPLTNRAQSNEPTKKREDEIRTRSELTWLPRTCSWPTMRFVYRRWRAHMRHTGFASWCVCRSRRKGRPKWERRFMCAMLMCWWQWYIRKSFFELQRPCLCAACPTRDRQSEECHDSVDNVLILFFGHCFWSARILARVLERLHCERQLWSGNGTPTHWPACTIWLCI